MAQGGGDRDDAGLERVRSRDGGAGGGFKDRSDARRRFRARVGGDGADGVRRRRDVRGRAGEVRHGRRARGGDGARVGVTRERGDGAVIRHSL